MRGREVTRIASVRTRWGSYSPPLEGWMAKPDGVVRRKVCSHPLNPMKTSKFCDHGLRQKDMDNSSLVILAEALIDTIEL